MWRDFMDSTPGPEVGCGKANRPTAEGGGEAGPKVAAKLGVRTSVSVDYPKPNRHRKHDKETL
jgi:hypothetical protein